LFYKQGAMLRMHANKLKAATCLKENLLNYKAVLIL